MQTIFRLCAAILMTGAISAGAADKLTVPQPAYAKNQTKRNYHAFIVPGKSLFTYRGAAISVRCFNSGTPQLYFSEPSPITEFPYATADDSDHEM